MSPADTPELHYINFTYKEQITCIMSMKIVLSILDGSLFPVNWSGRSRDIRL